MRRGEPPRGAGDTARRGGAGEWARPRDTAARRGHRALPPRDRITVRGEGARPRGAGRRDGDIAPYRHGTQAWDTTTGHERGARARGHECGAWRWGAARGRTASCG